MGKKSKGRNYTSKGERPTVTKSVRKAIRRVMTPEERYVNQVRAWRAGKRVMLTMPNPNAAQTNKPFVRVEAREVWGSPFQKKA